jgi:hypothetical protein
MLIAEYS